jgi:hypothetical protein
MTEDEIASNPLYAMLLCQRQKEARALEIYKDFFSDITRPIFEMYYGEDMSMPEIEALGYKQPKECLRVQLTKDPVMVYKKPITPHIAAAIASDPEVKTAVEEQKRIFVTYVAPKLQKPWFGVDR